MNGKFLTFEQWKAKTGVKDGDYHVPCPSCAGTGIANKEIYTRHNCVWCGGSGLSGDVEDLYSHQRSLDLLMIGSGGSNANN